MLGVIVVFILVAVYFFPTISAAGSHHRNAGAIFALNLLLGWTFVGWVLALVWALTKGEPACGSNQDAKP